jgi:hypothetical protein
VFQPTKAEDAQYVSFVASSTTRRRNVRHRVKQRYLEREPYRRLCDSLATNTYVAWSQLQPVRAEPTEKGWTMAHLIFGIHFNGLLLWHLETLFGDSVTAGSWRSTSTVPDDSPRRRPSATAECSS